MSFHSRTNLIITQITQWIILFITLHASFQFPSIIYLTYSTQIFDEYFGPLLGQHGFNIGVMLSLPKSRGSITLQSRDPMESPLIDPNFMADPYDVETTMLGEYINSSFRLEFWLLNKTFRHVETLFVQSRNLVTSRPVIGSQSLFTFHQSIAGLLGTGLIKFLYVERPYA